MTEIDQSDRPEPKKKRGRPPRYAGQDKRQNFNFRITDAMRTRLINAVRESGRSLSEEIEFRLMRDFGWEDAKGDINKDLAEIRAIKSATYVQALRAAGLLILREISGKPVRAVVDLETLVAEADGLAHGLRSGFIADDKTPPPTAEQRAMTAEEDAEALRKADELRAQIQAMQDAAKKNEPDAA